jgi:hypothetical protein
LAALARGFCAFRAQKRNRPDHQRNDSLDFPQKQAKTAPIWPVSGSLSLSGSYVPLAGLLGQAATDERGDRDCLLL